jgi:hypothetical protein
MLVKTTGQVLVHDGSQLEFKSKDKVGDDDNAHFTSGSNLTLIGTSQVLVYALSKPNRRIHQSDLT